MRNRNDRTPALHESTWMIVVSRNPDNPEFEVVELKSNLSISLDRLVAVFLGLSTVTLLVAVGPLILGLWPVMVVALVHLIAVGICLRTAWRGHWVRERIQIGPGALRVDRYSTRGATSAEWPLAWVRVNVEKCSLGEKRVYLACQGRHQELGAFLPVEERLTAAEEINHRIRPLSAWTQHTKEQVSRG
jgi:uncharacterized membrane protein